MTIWRGRCRRGVRAVIVTTRAQNPTGAALSEDRAGALRALLAGGADDVLLVEDDHCAGISGVPLHALAGSTSHWAFVRSASKAYGPDLRVAVLGGRPAHRRAGARTAAAGPGLGEPPAAGSGGQLVVRRPGDSPDLGRAEADYTSNRRGLCRAGRARVTAAGRSGLNVWIPVPDETIAITRLLNAGWATAPGTVPATRRAGHPDHHRRPDRQRDRSARRRGRRGGARYRRVSVSIMCIIGVWRAPTSTSTRSCRPRSCAVRPHHKKAAVDFALRRCRLPLTREFLLGLEGVGWEGDLDDLRCDQPDFRR